MWASQETDVGKAAKAAGTVTDQLYLFLLVIYYNL